MLTSDARVVRGLSIANIVLSSLAIVGAILTLGITALTVVAMSDPSLVGVIEQGLDPSDLRDLRASGYSSAEAIALGTGIIGIGGAATGIWLLICGVLDLVASVLNLRSCTRPEKVKSSFVWAIVGAVMALLHGGLITMALFIVAAVYLNKMKKASAAAPYGYGYGQPGFSEQPGTYNAAAYAQPTPPRPYGQPQQPAAQQPAVQQPVATQQPAATQQPIAPVQDAGDSTGNR